MNRSNELDTAYLIEEKLIISKGDTITINVQGTFRSGMVDSAKYYGAQDGWYIAFKTIGGSPVYWKQGCDGGHITRLNSKDVM